MKNWFNLFLVVAITALVQLISAQQNHNAQTSAAKPTIQYYSFSIGGVECKICELKCQDLQLYVKQGSGYAPQSLFQPNSCKIPVFKYGCHVQSHCIGEAMNTTSSPVISQSELAAGVIFCTLYAGCKLQTQFNSSTLLTTALSNTAAYQQEKFNSILTSVRTTINSPTVTAAQLRVAFRKMTDFFSIGDMIHGNYAQVRSYLLNYVRIPLEFFVQFKQIQEIRLARSNKAGYEQYINFNNNYQTPMYNTSDIAWLLNQYKVLPVDRKFFSFIASFVDKNIQTQEEIGYDSLNNEVYRVAGSYRYMISLGATKDNIQNMIKLFTNPSINIFVQVTQRPR